MDVRSLTKEVKKAVAFYEQFAAYLALLEHVDAMQEEEARLNSTLRDLAIEATERRHALEAEYQAIKDAMRAELDGLEAQSEATMQGLAAQVHTVRDHLKDLRETLQREIKERTATLAAYKAEIATLAAEKEKLQLTITNLSERAVRS